VPRAVDAANSEVRFADGRAERFRTVVWATGYRIDDSWVDIPSEDGIKIGRHCRAPIPGLWIVRANLLASLHWGALDAAADLDRSGR
jgi:putative flavoprotein involved in K+ transport